jgi:hypothetical protein
MVIERNKAALCEVGVGCFVFVALKRGGESYRRELIKEGGGTGTTALEGGNVVVGWCFWVLGVLGWMSSTTNG